MIQAMQEAAGEMDQVSGLDASLTFLLYFSYLLYFSLVVSAVRCFSSSGGGGGGEGPITGLVSRGRFS